jgi:hypothetical protein
VRASVSRCVATIPESCQIPCGSSGDLMLLGDNTRSQTAMHHLVVDLGHPYVISVDGSR